jgi:hypothetical protein
MPSGRQGELQRRKIAFRDPLDVHQHGTIVDLHEDGEKGERRRNGRCEAHFEIRDPQKLGHDEGAGSHDGRHDLAHRRGRGLDRTCKVSGIACLFHQGNGEGPCGHRVGYGASRNHAEKTTGDHGSLGRSSSAPSRESKGKVSKELPGPRFLKEGAIKDEKEDELGRNPQGNAEDAIGREGEIGGKSLDGVSFMGQRIGKVRSQKRVEKK